MKNNKTEYVVINTFSGIIEAERKEKINNAVRNLCIIDIEKTIELDYNIDVAFHGSVSDPLKGGTLKC